MATSYDKSQCSYGTACWYLDDEKHCQKFEHPSYCSQKGSCENMEEDHLNKFCHVPLCEYGKKCLYFQKRDKKHCTSLRHCQPRCPYGNLCAHFHDQKHFNEEKHPFPCPCPLTPFHCPFYIELSEAMDMSSVSIKSQEHCLQYGHVCRFGRHCQNKAPLHHEKSIHIARYLCPYDGKCRKVHQEEHLNSYTHSNVADIRRVCTDGDQCSQLRKFEHTIRHRHARINENIGVVRYHGLNLEINFIQNHHNSINRVLTYIQNKKWKPLSSGDIPSEILEWCHIVKPVHRCNPIVFESIFLHGHVMSREYMENLKNITFVVNSIMHHGRIRRIENLNIPQITQYAKEYVTTLVTTEFEKANFPSKTSDMNKIKVQENRLVTTINARELDVLKTKAIEIAQAAIKLHSNPAGIGHQPDKILGTHKHIFAVLGPHLGHYYGDVFIVFKRDILHHPDSNVCVQAATTCLSGNAFRWRPWLGADPGTEDKRVQVYGNTKLHAAVPGFEKSLALELMAITSQELSLNSMDIDLKTMFNRWLKVDSHRTIEAHLPELISLDYIDHIYIPQNLLDTLSTATRSAIDIVFKNSITISPYEGDINQETKVFQPLPNKKERADHQNFVVDKLMKHYDRTIQTYPARPIQGTIITIPGSKCTENVILPLTISQAYEHYRIENHENPSDNIVYIYWQAMNGNIMLVLSNEALNHEKDQTRLRCLICYIASRIESPHDTNYHEGTTYLNCGQPIQHPVFVTKHQYRASSNTFHMGSNMDDYITYCLEIHRADGKVILRQAGSNAIYNHQQLTTNFNRKELDLEKLEFIHLTTDSKNVPVRNLIVCFEKQMELHPSFDPAYKKTA